MDCLALKGEDTVRASCNPEGEGTLDSLKHLEPLAIDTASHPRTH